jgi:hypothetical protein
MRQLVLLLAAFLLSIPSTLRSQYSGTALRFDGIDDYVSVADQAVWPSDTNAFTVELWVKFNSVPTNAVLIGQDEGGGSMNKWLAGFLGGVFYFHVNGSNGNVNPISYPWTPVPDVFYHLAVTRRGDRFDLYRDGELVVSGSATIAIPDVSADLTIGQAENFFFNGELDDVRIWSVARTRSEIASSMYRPLTYSEPGLVAGWQFNEGGGTSISSNGNYIGTLMNGPQWITSTIPYAAASDTRIVHEPGEVMFTGASLFAAFQAKSGADTVSVIRLTSPIQGTIPSGSIQFHAGTWQVRSTENGSFTADLTFGLGAGALTLADQEDPSGIKLFRRAIGSAGAWTLVGTGAKASFGSVTFNDINEFGEFAIGTSTSSPLTGSGGVFQSAATGTWHDAASWYLIGGNDDDGIPEQNDDVIIRAGDQIQCTTTAYCTNLLLYGASTGTRLIIDAGIGCYMTGVLNSDAASLSPNLIVTGPYGNLTFNGSSRQVIGNNWSGDVSGWAVNFSMNGGDTARVFTDFKAGTISVNSCWLSIGSYEAPKNLYVDGGTENSGNLSVNSASLFVSGNISRTNSFTSKFNDLTASWSTIEMGGTYLSAEKIRFGWNEYYYSITCGVRIRAASGLLITTGSYSHVGSLEYIGTTAQTTGNEFISIGDVFIKNPNGVQFMTSSGTINLHLDSGNVTIPSGVAYTITNLYGKGHEINGAGDLTVSERIETAHAAGLAGLLRTTGTTSIGGYGFALVFKGTEAQHTGTLHNWLNSPPYQHTTITVDNPSGVTLEGSYYANGVVLTNGNVTVNAPDTLSVNSLTANTGEITGPGMYIQKPGSVSTAHASGLDGTLKLSSVFFENPNATSVTFNGIIPQQSGLKLPDSLGSIGIPNSAGFTLSKSLAVPGFDLNGQSSDLYLPSGVTFRASSLNGGAVRKIFGAGNFFLSNTGTFTTEHPDGMNGTMQLTGTMTFGDSATINLYGNITATGTLLPDTVMSLVISTSGSAVLLSKPVAVRSSLALSVGALDNSSHNVTMLDGSTLSRHIGSIAHVPAYQNVYDITYSPYVGVSGNEIPNAATVLRHFSGNSFPRMTKDLTVNGSLGLNVDADTFTVRMNGTMGPGVGVIGRLIKPMTMPGQYSWEVRAKGNAKYLPFKADAASFNGSGTTAVTLRDTASVPLPVLPPGNKFLQYYFSAEQQGISNLKGTVTLSYDGSDVPIAGIPDEDSLFILQWKDSLWQNIPVISRDKISKVITAGPIDTLTMFLIAGTEMKGIASFSTKEIQFGDVVRPEMKYDTLYIKNTGTWPLQFTNIGFTDPYTFGGTLSSYVIPVGDSVQFIISFNAYHGGIETKAFLSHNGTTGIDTVVLKGRAIYPTLTFSTNYLGFGTVPVGESRMDSVLVYNTGTYPLIISGIAFSSPSFTARLSKDTIAVSDSAYFYITFAPQSEGTYNEWIALRNNIYGSGDGYRIYPGGIATASQFAVHPAALNFGNVQRGQSKKDSVLVKNPGAAVLHIASISSTIAGYAATPSTIDVPSGDSVWIVVTFAPQSQGDLTGELVFHHSATTTSPDSVHLTGTGIEPVFAGDKSSFNFGSVMVGNTRIDSLFVTNTGNTALHIASIQSTDSVQFSVMPTSAVLDPMQKQKFTVAFSPVYPGNQYGSMKFTHNGTPDTNIVTLAGFGTLPVFTPSRRTVVLADVSVDSTVTDTLSVTNTGNTSLFITSVATTDSQFTVAPASVILSAGARKVFTVRFTARKQGVSTGALLFTHTGKHSPDTITVQGNGVELLFTASRKTVHFGNVRINTAMTDSVIVTNRSLQPLTISSASVQHGEFLASPNSANLASGEAQTFLVTFHPVTAGMKSGGLVFVHNARTSPDTVLLEGTGVEVFPVAVELAAPLNGAVVPTMTPLLQWHSSVRASGYHLQVATSDSFTIASMVTDRSLVTDTSAAVGPLTSGALYYWRVQSTNQFGNSAWSGPWSFSTETLPDLTVAQVQVPSAAWSGQEFQMSWSVKNTGTASTGSTPWADNIYLSLDSTFTLQSFHLATVENMSALAPGEQYTNSASFTLPVGATGNYFLRVVSDAGGAVRELQETNNSGRNSAPMIVSLTPPPDLQVTSLIAPVNAFSGQSIDVSWAVNNLGTGATRTDTWEDGIYLSQDTVFNASAVHIGSYTHTGKLAVGSGYVNSATVALPPNIHGRYYLYLFTDNTNAVFEHAQEYNNHPRTDSLVVTLLPPPDLAVTEFRIPDSAYSGGYLQLRVKVENQGPGTTTASSWTDLVHLSSRPDFIPDSTTVIGTYVHSTELQPDSSYVIADSVKIPQRIFGPYYVIVQLDAYNQQFEYTYKANNIVRSDTVMTVRLTSPPDLIVTHVEVPATAQSGKPLVVQWTTKNNGEGAPYETAWHDRIMMSHLPAFDEDSSFQIGSVEQNSPAAPGTAAPFGTECLLPEGLSGVYYVYVITDGANEVFEHLNETNNTGRSAAHVSVTLSPWADLRVQSVQTAATVRAGDSLVVRWTVSNAGLSVTPVANWMDRLYLSDDSLFNAASDQRIGTVAINTTLSSGASYDRQFNVLVPPSMSGRKYFFVRTDDDDAVYEYTGEGNNTSEETAVSVQPYPQSDLAVKLLDAPAAAMSGQQVTVAWEVTNTGTVRTVPQEWYDAVYLSADSILTPAVSPLKQFQRTMPLSGGARYTMQQSVNIPNGLSGPYYLYVVADVYASVNDTARVNNAVRSAKSIPVTLTQSPDLTIASFTAPSVMKAGQQAMVRWDVVNSGTGGTGMKEWFDAVYLSADSILDPYDEKLGTRNNVRTLVAAQSYAESLLVEIPSAVVGTHYLFVHLDSRDDLYEHHAEGNNAAMCSVSIVLPPPADLRVTNITVPSAVVSGDEITVTWNLINTGINPADGYVKDGIYVSTDTVWQSGDPLIGFENHYINIPPGTQQPMSFTASMSRLYLTDANGNITTEMPGVPPGPYHIIVRTDVRNTMRETNEQNNATASEQPMQVGFPMVNTSSPAFFTLKNNESKYFYFDANEGEDYRVTLTSAGGMNELYIAEGHPPTRSEFDIMNTEQYASNQTVSVPKTNTGRYYILLRSSGQPAGGSASSLSIRKLEFSINSVATNRIGDREESSVELFGAQFDTMMSVGLKLPNGRTVSPNAWYLVNSTHYNARFSAESLSLGKAEVVVRSSAGIQQSLPSGMTVESTRPTELIVNVSGPSSLRFGQIGQFYLNAYNPTNVNIPRAMIFIETRQDAEIQTFDDVSADLLKEYHRSYDSFINESGNRVSVIILSNIGPERTKSVPMLVKPLAGGKFTFRIETNVYTRTMFDTMMVRSMLAAALSGLWDLPPGTTTGAFAGASVDLEKMLKRAYTEHDRMREKIRDVAGYAENATKTLYPNPFAPGKFLKPGKVWEIGKLWMDTERLMKKWNDIDGEGGEFDCVVPRDPNDIVGPAGTGDARWVAKGQTLPYTVRFENDPKRATAPAQVITITQQLDSSLDARSFRLGSFGFRNMLFTVPANRSYHTERLDLRSSAGIYVDVNAGIDVTARKVFWIFRSIDPATGDVPTGAAVGMLPVNDSTNIGTGFASYSIRPDQQRQQTSFITAKASIIFDLNETIDTPPFVNTLDAGIPVSAVQILPSQVSPGAFTVRWHGADEPFGSGIRRYSVYAARNDEPYTAWLTGVTDTSAEFMAELGCRYRFFSLAEDLAGNTEQYKIIADASTTVTSVASGTAPLPTVYSLSQNFPNPFNPSTTIRFGVPKTSSVKIEVFDVLGRKVAELFNGMMEPGYRQITWNASLASGMYLYRIESIASDDPKNRFIQVKKMLLMK